LMQFRQEPGHVDRQHRLLARCGFAVGRDQLVWSTCGFDDEAAGMLGVGLYRLVSGDGRRASR
jgi:hypothetical protein